MLVVFRASFRARFTFVHLSVAAQIGNDAEMAAASFYFAGESWILLDCFFFGGIVEVKGKDLRFSPVWLYICVCSELGRVKRLSHTLHLCFFCVLDETLELNWPIIDCGAGGIPPLRRPEGRGSVREDTDSISEPAFE